MKQNSVNAAVMTAPGKFEVRRYPYPEVDDVSMVIELEMCGLCGTDKHTFRGETVQYAGTPAESHTPFPIIPGHVSVGTADKVRGDVRGVDGAAIAEGDRLVFFDVHRTCGRCRACAVTRTPTRCEARRVYGITDSAADGLFGGWAEAIYLEPGVAMAKLPDGKPVELKMPLYAGGLEGAFGGKR